VATVAAWTAMSVKNSEGMEAMRQGQKVTAA
jgi:hypothetical protein